MRYRGGPERSREVFSIHCNAVQNSHTEKGRCFNYSPVRKAWLILQSSGLNEGPHLALFGVTQTQEFRSLQRGQNVTFSSHQLSPACTFTLQGKTNKTHGCQGVWWSSGAALAHSACLHSRRRLPCWDCSGTSRLSPEGAREWENCRAVCYRHFVFPC